MWVYLVLMLAPSVCALKKRKESYTLENPRWEDQDATGFWAWYLQFFPYGLQSQLLPSGGCKDDQCLLKTSLVLDLLASRVSFESGYLCLLPSDSHA